MENQENKKMDTDILDREIARKSAVRYLTITLTVAVVFFAVTGWIGTYPLVARIGGLVWISLLTLIVSMRVVTSRMKKKVKGAA